MISWKNELAVIRPSLGEKIGAFFTERVGGVSSGPWGGPEGIMGLNVGERVEDNAGCVRMNRSIVADLCPSEPRWMTQVHGIGVVKADDVTDESIEADAQYTVTPGVVCCVQVADCLPVLVADRNARIVAAVHAGWKSLAAGVIEETVKAVKNECPDAQLAAWLGPRIGFDDFEVGAQVADMFRQKYPQYPQGIRLQGDKAHVDLAGFAKAALAAVGVTQVQDCGLSTVSEPKRFYSYRRDGAHTGRHAAVIWIEQ